MEGVTIKVQQTRQNSKKVIALEVDEASMFDVLVGRVLGEVALVALNFSHHHVGLM